MTSKSDSYTWISLPLSKKKQQDVLQACFDQIHDLLHLESVFAYLVQENLLTQEEQEDLQSSNSRLTDEEKISHFLSSLPKKGPDALQRFLKCLRSKTDGTAHAELADFIQEQAVKIEKKLAAGRLWTVLILTVSAVCCLLLYFNFPAIKYNFNLIHHSKTLPYPSEHFVGREQEVQDLLHLVDFGNSNTRIVNIVGSPGFGKSTLAIHVGHKMVEIGIVVHYVNMAEFPESKQIKKILAEKILKSAEISVKHVTFERVLEWARDRWYWNHLLILDNCDDVLHRDQKEAFELAVDSLIRQSQKIKILTTSRKVMMYLEYFEQYKLYELSTKAACVLLENKIPKSINMTEQEKESIAELTGNVPLALQVVGSLLSLPDPPTPKVIVKELSEKPMKTLSPEQLSENKQVFASISLSYRYLEPHLKVFGQIIANFPSSFHKDDLYLVYIRISFSSTYMPSTSETLPVYADAKFCVNSLVQRSLLFFDQRTDRYQYHRLIREFFLDVQGDKTDTKSNLQKFVPSFLACFSQKLLRVADEFQKDPVKSLSILDTERQNINVMLGYLRAIRSIKMSKFIIESVLTTFTAISNAESVGLLSCRFTNHELQVILTSILDHLNDITHYYDSYTNNSTASPIIARDIFYFRYIALLVRLATLKDQLHSTEAALHVLLGHITYVEVFKPIEAGSVSYISFLKNLAHYRSILGQHAEAIECHRKIITESEHHILHCQPNECRYFDLGLIYKSMGRRSVAIDLFEKSLTLENHDVFPKLRLLIELYLLYKDVGNNETVTNTLESLIKHCKEIPKIPIFKLYQQQSYATLAVVLLRKIGMNKEAVELEERLLQVVKDIGVFVQKEVTLESVHNVALHFYTTKSYTKTVELIQFVLRVTNQTEHDVIISKMKLLSGKAKFDAGNYSAGLDDIEAVFLDFLNRHTNISKEELRSACWYLTWRIKYINLCYRIDRRLHLAAIKIMYAIFAQSIDIYATPQSRTDTNHKAVTQLPISTVPEISYTFQSHSTHLANTMTGNDIVSFFKEQIILRSFNSIVGNFWSNVYSVPTNAGTFMEIQNFYFLQTITYNPFIRALYNILVIWVRLCLIYLFWKVFCKIRRIIGIICYTINIIHEIIDLYILYGVKWQGILLWLTIINSDPRYSKDIGYDERDFVQDFNSLPQSQCKLYKKDCILWMYIAGLITCHVGTQK